MRTYASIYAESISVSAIFESLLQAPQQQQRARLYRVSPCCSAELDFLGQGVDFSNLLPPTHSLQGSHRQEWRSGTGFRVFTLNIYELRNRASVKTGTDASPS